MDQGYNAQAATNQHGIVIAAEVTVASPDSGDLEPMANAGRPNWRPSVSMTHPKWCLPVRATDIRSRWSVSSHLAAECWSRPTPVAVITPGRGGMAGCKRSCAACFKASVVPSSTRCRSR